MAHNPFQSLLLVLSLSHLYIMACCKVPYLDYFFSFVYNHSLMILFTVMASVIFIYLTLALLGLQGCSGFSPVGVTRDYSLGAMLGLLTTVASLVSESGLYDTWASAVAASGFSNCGALA